MGQPPYRSNARPCCIEIFELDGIPPFNQDMDGKMRYRHYGESMSDIPPDEKIPSLLDEMNDEREDKR